MDPLESFSEEPISQLGALPFRTLSLSETVLDAVRLMQSSKRGCVLVCDGTRPVGVLTERDILRRMGTSQPLEVPVGQAVSGVVWSVRQTDSIATALRIMTRRQCRHLVVMSETGEAVGILSVRRIIRALVENFPSSIYNLPPTAGQVPKAREGA